MTKQLIAVLVAGGAIALLAGIGIGRSSVNAEATDSAERAVGALTHPAEIERDFATLYNALDAYRRRHGVLPGDRLLLDTSKPLVDGIRLSQDDFTVPGWSDTERGAVRPNGAYFYSALAKRPDGVRKPAFPTRGERDVWMYSDLATSTRSLKHDDGTRDLYFSGVYVVLFSDGSIERFSHRQLFFVESNDPLVPGHVLAFPGMTGYTKVAYTWVELNNRAARTRVVYEN